MTLARGDTQGKEQSVMRQEIAFNAEGVTLRGWLYLPDRTAGPVPAIVMAHGFSAVKEMYLDAFAEVFVQAGFGALVFDNRNFGASDGEPRQEIEQIPRCLRRNSCQGKQPYSRCCSLRLHAFSPQILG
jgi:dienelactone hydrolase